MLQLERLKREDLKVGVALPFSIYDEEGLLLLKKGYKVRDEGQVERLAQVGFFVPKDDIGTKGLDNSAQDLLCPFDIVQHIYQRLDILFSAICSHSLNRPLEEAMLELVLLVERSCLIDPDATLACVILGDQGLRYAIKHAIDTAILSCLLANQVRLDPAERHATIASALTMNLSVYALQDVLQKQNETLTPEQQSFISNHPSDTAILLSRAGVKNEKWLETIRQHHEMYDGSGYPNGLKGDEISITSQLVSVSDMCTAMLSIRSYRPSFLPNNALRELFLSRGQVINTKIAAFLIKELGVYPPGTLFRLENGQIAIAIKRGQNAHTPQIVSITDSHWIPLHSPIKRDVSMEGFRIKEVLSPYSPGMPSINRYIIWGYYRHQMY